MDLSKAVSAEIDYDKFLDSLKELPWCKQGDSTLVAVHKCTPEVIDVMQEKPVKVYPGGMQIKSNKSWLTQLKSKFEDGLAVPLLMVWKEAGLELWYRKHKSAEFPYDTWTDPAAAAYEKEQVCITTVDAGDRLGELYKEMVGKAPACPPSIPEV